MTAFVERMVQKISEGSPFESAVSHLVAGVLENTAMKLARCEPVQVDAHVLDAEAA